MPPVSWQNALDDVGYMSDEHNTLVHSPLRHNHPWLKPPDASSVAQVVAPPCPPPNNTGAVRIGGGRPPQWNVWNPVPFPRWQFHLNSAQRNELNNRQFVNTSPRSAAASYMRGGAGGYHDQNTASPSIMLNESPSSPQSIITISSSSDNEDEMKAAAVGMCEQQPAYSGRRSQSSSHNPQDATTSGTRFFAAHTTPSQQQQLQRTIKSSNSPPFVPSFPNTAMSSLVQRSSSPQPGGSGSRSFKNPHNMSFEESSPFLHMGKEEQPSPSLIGSSSLGHCVPSAGPRHDLVRPSTFKYSMNSSFEAVNSFQSNNNNTSKEKIHCKQEPVFLVTGSTHTTMNANTVPRPPNAFPSPVVCRIPMTDTSMCVIQPSFITTPETNNISTTAGPYMNPIAPAPPTIIPQNICVHLPYGVLSNGAMNCTRCPPQPRGAVVPAPSAAPSIGRLHLSQNLHMIGGLQVSSVSTTSSLHHTTGSAIFHPGGS